MRWLLWMLVIALPALSGCASDVVLVQPGDPVMLAEPVVARLAHYSGRDGAGNPIWTAGPNREKVPAGSIISHIPATTAPAH